MQAAHALPSRDPILEEVMSLMTKAPDGKSFVFEQPPTFLLERLRAIPDVSEQRKTVKNLASFAFFLATKQGSEEASATIMKCLDEAIAELQKTNGVSHEDAFER